VNVLVPAPFLSRGWGCRSGWPSYSHRPASIDPRRAHSIGGRSLSRFPPKPSLQRFDGQRLAAPRVTDRPRLVGWSSLHPVCHRSLTSLCRRCGHRLAGTRTGGKLARRAPRRVRLALTRSTEITATTVLADCSDHDRDAFRRAAKDRVLPRSPCRACFLV